MKSTTLNRAAVAFLAVTAVSMASTAGASEKGPTREQVKAELKAALAKGEVYISETEYPKWPEFKVTKTCDQVKQELALATAQGEVYFNDVNYPPTPTLAYATIKAPDVANAVKNFQETVVAWVKKAASLI